MFAPVYEREQVACFCRDAGTGREQKFVVAVKSGKVYVIIVDNIELAIFTFP